MQLKKSVLKLETKAQVAEVAYVQISLNGFCSHPQKIERKNLHETAILVLCLFISPFLSLQGTLTEGEGSIQLTSSFCNKVSTIFFL
jgi:hypothetical protein